jgi:hypothetical protein
VKSGTELFRSQDISSPIAGFLCFIKCCGCVSGGLIGRYRRSFKQAGGASMLVTKVLEIAKATAIRQPSVPKIAVVVAGSEIVIDNQTLLLGSIHSARLKSIARLKELLDLFFHGYKFDLDLQQIRDNISNSDEGHSLLDSNLKVMDYLEEYFRLSADARKAMYPNGLSAPPSPAELDRLIAVHDELNYNLLVAVHVNAPPARATEVQEYTVQNATCSERVVLLLDGEIYLRQKYSKTTGIYGTITETVRVLDGEL